MFRPTFPGKRSSSTRKAFTLVELLVVIGIIALLISILLPSLSKARKQAQRVACASNIRQFCMAMIMMAQENRGKFPDMGNMDHYWDTRGSVTNTNTDEGLQVIHPAARDELVEKYGMLKKMFYCPSNPDMMTDANWSRPDKNNFAFTGVMILAGRKGLCAPYGSSQLSPTFKGFEEVAAANTADPIFANKIGQKPFYPVMVADTTRSYKNELNPSNHVAGQDPTGYLPLSNDGGANIGYLDGHVEWKKQNDMGQTAPNQRRRQFYMPDVRFYF